MINIGSSVSAGHPVKLRKADIKNTKKCIITSQYIENHTLKDDRTGLICYDGKCTIVEYLTGISKGKAIFPCNYVGDKALSKFLKLLNK